MDIIRYIPRILDSQMVWVPHPNAPRREIVGSRIIRITGLHEGSDRMSIWTDKGEIWFGQSLFSPHKTDVRFTEFRSTLVLDDEEGEVVEAIRASRIRILDGREIHWFEVDTPRGRFWSEWRTPALPEPTEMLHGWTRQADLLAEVRVPHEPETLHILRQMPSVVDLLEGLAYQAALEEGAVVAWASVPQADAVRNILQSL